MSRRSSTRVSLHTPEWHAYPTKPRTSCNMLPSSTARRRRARRTSCVDATCVGQPCAHDVDCTGPDATCLAGACIATPFSPTGIGAPCSGGEDCVSADCRDGPTAPTRCSLTCVVDVPSAGCPTGFDCIPDPDVGPPDSDGACAGRAPARAAATWMRALGQSTMWIEHRLRVAGHDRRPRNPLRHRERRGSFAAPRHDCRPRLRCPLYSIHASL